MKAFKFTLFLLIAASFALFGQDASSGDSGSVSASSSSGAASAGVGLAVGSNYVLKPSDVIDVSVYQENDLSKQARIEGDGTVSLALIGKVKVAGMTVAESQLLITDLYNRDYIVDPQVSVLVVSFSPKFVRVLGHVGSPGQVQIPPDQELTLIDAITQCRGVTRLGNDKNVTISRVKESGQTQSFEVNFKKIKLGEAKDYVLQEGDTIYVPERVI
ncbi:MAG: polysaccharide biosynthesis/export family protein [Coraliomargarita sp.]